MMPALSGKELIVTSKFFRAKRGRRAWVCASRLYRWRLRPGPESKHRNLRLTPRRPWGNELLVYSPREYLDELL
jgi:hypothetical protein